MRISLIAAALALTLSAGAPVASAAPPVRPDAGRAAVIEKPVRVQVSFQVPLPDTADNLKDRLALLEKGRKMIYAMAGTECAQLLAAIAKTCTLKSLNVRNQVRNPRHMPTITMSGSATYEITLKSAD